MIHNIRYLLFLMLYILLSLDILNAKIFSINSGDSTSLCCSARIYGDSLSNEVEQIQSHNGHTYLLGFVYIDGEVYGTFSKFKGDGSLLWQYRTDAPSRFFDFTPTADSAFMLTGRTEPVGMAGNWLDNQSILAKIDEQGTEVFIRSYDNSERETFLSIVHHPNAVNAAFPYYLTGAVNSTASPSSFDRVQLTNLSEDGTINWTHEYAYESDDEFGRKPIPLSDGSILLRGVAGIPNEAYMIKVNGSDGVPLLAKQSVANANFLSALELPDGRIVGAGHVINSGVLSPVIALYDSNLNVLGGLRLPNSGNDLRSWRSLSLGTDQRIYAVAEGMVTQAPVISKFSVSGNQLQLEQSVFYREEEVEYLNPRLFSSSSSGKLYYADARKEHSLSYGDFDILWGAFNSELDDPCLTDTVLAPADFSLSLTNAIGSNQSETMSAFSEVMDIQPISFELTEICINICCDLSIYGDSLSNEVEQIQSHNGHTYLLGFVYIDGEVYGTFSKFKGDGSLLWQYRTDAPSRFFDFTPTADSAFMLTGRTEPVGMAGNWLDNQSILAKIDEQGTEVFIRSYDNSERETFLSIVHHPNAVNAAFPYYLTGAVNSTASPSSFDRVQLTNLSEDGTINWTHEYAYESDDEFGRKPIPLSDGSILLRGVAGIPNEAYMIKVNGSDGVPLLAKQSVANANFLSALELPDGRIVGAGHVINSGVLSPVIALYDSNLNVLGGLHLPNSGNDLRSWRSLSLGTDQRIYAVAEGMVTQAPVISKFSVSGNQLQLEQSVFYRDEEVEYLNPRLFSSSSSGKLYYADARKEHSLSYGDFDILWGAFNSELDDPCLTDTTLAPADFSLSLTNAFGSNQAETLPAFTEVLDLTVLNYDWEPLCDEIIVEDTCCKEELFLTQYNQGFEIRIEDSVVTVVPNSLDSCSTVWIDFGDETDTVAIAGTDSAMHIYSDFQEYVLCISALQYNADGVICLKKDTCELVIISTNGIKPLLDPLLKVYPNPFSDHFVCEKIYEGVLNISILDMLGRTHYEQKLDRSTQKYMFDLSGMTNGVYLIKVENEDHQLQHLRIIKN